MRKTALIFLVTILLVFGIIILKYKTYAAKELPKVYITVNDEDAFRNLTKEDGEKTASLIYDDGSGESINSYIKIKVQGSTSAKYPKKNYTIKLYQDSEYLEKQKIDIGWGKFNKYCLKANWIDDKTHSRNIVTAKLTAKVQNEYGLFIDTPNNGVIDGFPIEVYLNNQFLGLYTWNIPKDAWMWNLDEDNPNNIAMEAGMCTDSTYLKKEIASVEALGEDESDSECSGWVVEVGSETQETVDKFNRLISFVKDSTDEEFINNFDSYINKDAMLNYLVIQYMAEATDNVAKNMIWVTYDGKIWYPTLYDLDTTYGTHHRGLKLHDNYLWLPENDENEAMESAPHANKSLLLKKVIRCFPDEFAERWFELRKDILSDEQILNEFSNFIGHIPESTFDLESTTWANSSWNGQTWKEIPGFDFEQIKDFLGIRLPYIDEVMYNKYTDDMPATLSLEYSITTPTIENVTVTVVPNRNDITFGTNPTTYTFTSNGTYTFIATDGGGNEVTETATVDWIDIIKPTLEIKYSKTEMTNEDVIVTITASEEIQEIDGWMLSENKKVLTKTYTANSSETVEVYDIAGNKSEEKQVNVNIIDKVKPEIEVNYNKTEMTNDNVIVTIKANENIQQIEGWVLSTNGQELSKVYSNNTVEDGENIIIKDIAGNEKSVNVKILNIDKMLPMLTLKIQKTTTTITVQAIASDQQTGIDENTYKYYVKEENEEYGPAVGNGTKHTFTNLSQGVKYQIKVKVSDKVGNVTTKEIEVVTLKEYKVTSTIYNVDEEKLIVKEIQAKTTIKQLQENIQSTGEYEIIDETGTVVLETSYVATGYKIKISNDKIYTIIVKGDSNGDSKADMRDILAINKHRLKKVSLAGVYLQAADVNEDGNADIRDILQINKFRLGKIGEL